MTRPKAEPIAMELEKRMHPIDSMVGQTRYKFRRDIEGLRAIAVLTVVGYHFGVPGLTGGFIGVDIFFVISGYLITGLLLSELKDTGRVDLLRFYGRRARRLLPAALLVTLATLICGGIILSPGEQLFMAKAATASSLYVSNFWFALQAFDYFSPENAANPFLHTWSLSVEEQFYIVWPGLLMFVGRPKFHPRLLLIAMGIATITSFVLCVWLTIVKQPLGFYTSPTRGWEFGIGGLASLAPVTRWNRTSNAAPVIGWLGMLLILVSLFAIDEASRFPGPDALLPAAGTVFVLMSGAGNNRRGPALLLNTKLLGAIGALSYSIYLWHWPIIVYAAILVSPLSGSDRVACFALTLACAIVSYRLLEHPVRLNRWLIAKSARSVGVGAILTFVGALVGFGEAALARHFLAIPAQTTIEDVAGKSAIASEHGCLIKFTNATPVACSFGATKPVRTVVLFGDSHADQWSTTLVSIADQEHWRLVTYLKASCAVSSISVYNMRLHRISPECAQWRSSAIAAIVGLRPDLVVIAQFSSGYIRGPLTNLGAYAVDLETWSEGLKLTLGRLSDAGLPVLVLRDSPTPGRNIRRCLAEADWRGRQTSSCAVPRVYALNAAVTEAERSVVNSLKGVHFMDLSSDICDTTTCPPVRDGTIVYRDANHLTVDYAERLLDPLKDEMVQLMTHP